MLGVDLLLLEVGEAQLCRRRIIAVGRTDYEGDPELLQDGSCSCRCVISSSIEDPYGVLAPLAVLSRQ